MLKDQVVEQAVQEIGIQDMLFAVALVESERALLFRYEKADTVDGWRKDYDGPYKWYYQQRWSRLIDRARTIEDLEA